MKNRLAWGLVACVFLTSAVLFEVRLKHQMYDFEVYRVAGVRAAAGEPLYRLEDGHWQFKYFPAFALLIAPIAQLPPVAARGVWLACSLGLVILLVNRSLALLPGRRHTAVFLAGFTTLAMGKFYVREIGLGQSNILLAVVVLLAVAQWWKGRDAAAGSLFAAATIVKPYAVLFLPYLLLRRRFRAAAAYVVVIVLALLLPAVRYGFAGNVALLRGWFDTVTHSTAPNLAGQDNTSIAGMFAAWLGVGPAASWLALAVTLVLLAACTRALVKNAGVEKPEYLDAGLLLFLIPLVSPQGWDYVLLLSTPVVMLLIDRLDLLRRPVQWLLVTALAIVALTIWDLMGREPYRLFMLSRLVTICALVEVAIALRLRTMKTA
jgi:hypothetical protein